MANIGLLWTILFTALLIPLGIVFRWPARFRNLAPLLLLAGVWSLPQLINVLLPDQNIAFEYSTYDTVLTGVLFILAVLGWRGKNIKTNNWIITLVLVVSTLVVLGESPLINQTYLGISIFLVLPWFYQVFFDSEELNMAGETQVSRVIRTLGSQAGLLLVVAWAFTLGMISPVQNNLEAVAAKIFLPPFLALFLVATISNRANLSDHLPEEI
jgi:hypothetical protein